MANSTTTQILLDGPRNVVVKFEGVLDTSDLSSTVVLDPSVLATININSQLPTKLNIRKLTFFVEDTLDVRLFWDATTPVRIETLVGRGKVDYRQFGGLYPSAATVNSSGFTGKITAITQGWATGATLEFTVIMECIKEA